MGSIIPAGDSHCCARPPAVARLVFTWPDYPNTRVSKQLALKDDGMEYNTRGAFAKQIAVLFEHLIQKHGHEYVPPVGRRGWRLGPGGIQYEQLRLLEIFSADGQNFHARMGVVPPHIGTSVARDAVLL
ncbi:hypothetical protein MVEN_02397800 [Mycena venus]|uniref:Uncharacterized protein n=1 Tax=Mycena venus TaxID=2733690 RepID=A0A8H7CCV1_9AGAR|nr:hypothetical protein MVEN_02397800 [Mycena venus]